MQIKLLGVLGHQPVNDLLVTRGAERTRNNRLRFAALEECRAVRSGEKPDFHLQRADLCQVSTVCSRTVFRDQPVRCLFLQFAEGFLGVRLTLQDCLRVGREEHVRVLHVRESCSLLMVVMWPTKNVDITVGKPSGNCLQTIHCNVSLKEHDQPQ